MKTLITGATGFLGSHLLRELIKNKSADTLRIIARGAAPENLPRGVEVIRGSVLDLETLKSAVDGVNEIYHLAGFVSRKPSDRHRMYDVHVAGTRLLCEAAQNASVSRILMTSTSGTIAVSDDPSQPLNEDSSSPIDTIARWPYYASKIYQEETARRICGDKTELVIVNPSLLLGPGDDRLSSTHDVLSFLAKDIPLTPPGGINFVDVRDVANILPEAMAKGVNGNRYLLGGVNWTFQEFFGRLERISKISAPRFRPRGSWPVFATQMKAMWERRNGGVPKIEPDSVEMARYFWYFESTKAITELGFTAREPGETLFDTVNYLRSHFMGQSEIDSRSLSERFGSS